MPLPKQPTLHTIFPIVKVSVDKAKVEFLGTGFFIEKNGKFLTAKHIFELNPLDKPWKEYEAWIQTPSNDVLCKKIRDMHLDPIYDIAWGRVEKYADIEPLRIATSNKPANSNILCIEYSGTNRRIDSDGKNWIMFRPNSHKGYIVAYFTDEPWNKQTPEMLELSFPALRGASGAPVIEESSGEVIGLVIANREAELLPTQILTTHNEDGTILEDIKYFIPRGLAISWSHLQAFITSK